MVGFEDEGGPTRQEHRWPLEPKKGGEGDSLLRASRRNQTCQGLDFKCVSDFWPSGCKRMSWGSSHQVCVRG